MSLVGDALRRARAEGARRRGVAIPPGLGPPIRRSLLGGPAAIVLSLVLVAAVAALVTWWLVGHARETPAEPVRHEGVESLTTLPDAGSTPAAIDGAATTPPPTAPPQTTDQASRVATSPPTEGETAGPLTAILATPVTEPPAPASEAPIAVAPGSPASNPHPAAAAERSFVIDAELGYATLHLDYLVYKPSAPFARINGRDVIVGSIVAGFQVEEIGPDYVRLSDSRGPLTLRVR